MARRHQPISPSIFACDNDSLNSVKMPGELISIKFTIPNSSEDMTVIDWILLKKSIIAAAELSFVDVDERLFAAENMPKTISEKTTSTSEQQSTTAKPNIYENQSLNCDNLLPDVKEVQGDESQGVASASSPAESSNGTPLESQRFTRRIYKSFEDPYISVLHDRSPLDALCKILEIRDFDPISTPQLQPMLPAKRILPMDKMKLCGGSIIELEVDKKNIKKYIELNEAEREKCQLNPFVDIINMVIEHPSNLFYTFCSCTGCEEFRDPVFQILAYHFHSVHMMEMLINALKKPYQPLLQKLDAYEYFEYLLENNREIYWLTAFIQHRQMTEHMALLRDENLSDHMALVLFSSILMANNPFLLLRVLAFHVKCVTKAYAHAFQVTYHIQNDEMKSFSSIEMLLCLLNGYDEFMHIAEQIANYLFAFENAFLRKFQLSWKLLCSRLYQQHVFLAVSETVLSCLSKSNDAKSSMWKNVFNRYLKFGNTMTQVEKHWTKVWLEFNKFLCSKLEIARCKGVLHMYNLLNVLVRDSVTFAFEEDVRKFDFFNCNSMRHCRFLWHKIISFAKTKWPKDFYLPPNTTVIAEKCIKCHEMVDFHRHKCKCVACSIAGVPLVPLHPTNGCCTKCCAPSDFLDEHQLKLGEDKETNDVCGGILFAISQHIDCNEFKVWLKEPSNKCYHISWAVFKHLNFRKRYAYATVEAKYFCRNCKLPPCLLAMKILNNEICPELTRLLIEFYQPILLHREELFTVLPNIITYTCKMIATNRQPNANDAHDYIVKVYWIYILSMYATHFQHIAIDRTHQTLDVTALTVVNNDISINVNKVTGNKNDKEFVYFLQKIKSISPLDDNFECIDVSQLDLNSEEIEKKLSEILSLCNVEITSACEEFYQEVLKRSTTCKPNDLPMTPLHNPPITDASSINHKPTNNQHDKNNKRCFNHGDLGEQCKENHASKKRLRKECNHNRGHETRDRLRKKLTRMKNSLQHTEPLVQPSAANDMPSPSAASSALMQNAKSSSQQNSNQDSMQNMKVLDKSTDKSVNKDVKQHVHTSSHVSNKSKKSKSNSNTENVTHDSKVEEASALPTDPKEQKKWLKEKLNFIEGVQNTKRDQLKKAQPQTSNPKKAAKKAKQKQRKEEQKRIAELHDLRNQFHNIYFKEFSNKHSLKILKSLKKKDKKKISELEANIKNLQRAKAKVESAILELIATVKQTNTEFKFSYLPTKEQQIEKLKQLEGNNERVTVSATTATPTTSTSTTKSKPAKKPTQKSVETMTEESIPPLPTILPANVKVFADGQRMPYAQANNFSYHFDLSAHAGQHHPPYHLMTAPPRVCFSPAASTQQQQQMPAINACSNNNNIIDPSKRIVTIRHINLPNVPEPQVIVTAKDSPCDKEKVLYTFINGQLVPNTNTNIPPASSEQKQNRGGEQNMPNDKLLASSTPSKSKLKRERKRRAKLKKLNNVTEEPAAKEQEQISQTTKKNKSANHQATAKQNATTSVKETHQSKKLQNESTQKLKQQPPPTAAARSICKQNTNNNSHSQKAPSKKNANEKQPSVAAGGLQRKPPTAQLPTAQKKQAQSEQKSEKACEKNSSKTKKTKTPTNTLTQSSSHQKPETPTVLRTSSAKAAAESQNYSCEADDGDFITAENKKSNRLELRKQKKTQQDSIASKPMSKKSSGKNANVEPNNTQKSNNPLGTNNNKKKQNALEKTTKAKSDQNAASNVKTSASGSKEVNARLTQTKNTSQTASDVPKSNSKSEMRPVQATADTSMQTLSPQGQQNNSPLYNLNCSPGMNYFAAQQANTSPYPTTPMHSYSSVLSQMQNFSLNNGPPPNTTTHSPQPAATNGNRQQSATSTNVSIMDQLNRGVQVENLALPPGITLTKVDPAKSEQLRQKSESIKKLSKPLQPATHAFDHPGATIIAPPVTPMSSYYSALPTVAPIDPQTGIIMVEANPPATATNAPPHSPGGKPTKSKKRRNKAKRNAASKHQTNDPVSGGSRTQPAAASMDGNNDQPKMVTLRNPMFHNAPNMVSGGASSILPTMLPNRPLGGYPLPTALPIDQPAAIIKNENGMYTIRNPALHQAVTSGLAMGGYHQFANVNYYTPQEAAAEAARATQQSQQQAEESNSYNKSESAFSYFSNNTIPATPNNISISCTNIGGSSSPLRNDSFGDRLSGDDAVDTTTTSQKCLSAIGSEKKNAQQQRKQQQVTKDQLWSLPSLHPVKNNGTNSMDLSLQDKYQQSKYYNGFVDGHSVSFPSMHMHHHSCGDDSPPPTLTGYTGSYLDGIPNTGVIQYNDASFLKNLLPGQNLNNEVSIHNVGEMNLIKDAQLSRNNRVEITPVYSNRSSANNLYDLTAQRLADGQSYAFPNYNSSLNDYKKESSLFANSDLHLGLNDFGSRMDYNYKDSSSTSASNIFASNSVKHNSMIGMNDLLNIQAAAENSPSPSSPYRQVDKTLDGLARNLSNLRIPAIPSTEPPPPPPPPASPADLNASDRKNNTSDGWWYHQ